MIRTRTARESSLGTRFRRHVRNRLVQGLALVIPLAVTAVVLRFLFRWLDGLTDPLVRAVMGRSFPGIGLVATVVVIYVAGVVSSSFITRPLLARLEQLVNLIPLVRNIFGGTKQFVESLSLEKRAFERVVWVEYPRKGAWALAFPTGEMELGEPPRRHYRLFVPTSPTVPGVLVILPQEEVHRSDLSVQEAMKMIISGGLVGPEAGKGDPG